MVQLKQSSMPLEAPESHDNQLTSEEEYKHLANDFQGDTEPYITFDEYLEFIDDPRVLAKLNIEITKNGATL
jgi:hypothetical protein